MHYFDGRPVLPVEVVPCLQLVPQHVACEHSHSRKAHIHLGLVNVAVYSNPQNAVYGNTQIKQEHFTVQKCVKQLIKLKCHNEHTIIDIER